MSLMPDSTFQVDEFYIDLQADGQSIQLLTEEQIKKSPFPGLRPFKTSEFQLFKGRDGQSQELITRLQSNQFLAVIGSSGTGKSSLVRAGLIPQLYGGFLSKAGSKWNIAICRPGANPIKNLSYALTSIKTRTSDSSVLKQDNDSIEDILKASPYGILEVNKQLKNHEESNKNTNLLIIVDQFEELFRFDRSELRKETAYNNVENAFVQLLLEAASGLDPTVYVLITMRSEFLGDCVKYRGLPEIINKSQYLVPQLSPIQLREVIEMPIMRAGKKIDPALVGILVNEIESEKLKENLDQLPILQHALMRSYEYAFMGPQLAERMEYKHYEQCGTMKYALANHASEVVQRLGITDTNAALTKNQMIVRMVFQALTDSGSDQKGGRRPTKLKDICNMARAINATPDEVNAVINLFREVETSFIMPPVNTNLYPELMLDISHESLMRNWTLLRNWIHDETDAAGKYKKLNDSREQFERDGETYLRGSLLNEIHEWQQTGLYNEFWAMRYTRAVAGKDQEEEKQKIYQANLVYLKQCLDVVEAEKRADQELAEKERTRILREKKRNFRLAIIGLVAAVLSISSGAYGIIQSQKVAASKIEMGKAEARRIAKEAERDRQNALAAASQKAAIDSVNREADIRQATAEARGNARIQIARAVAEQQAQLIIAKAKADQEAQLEIAKAKTEQEAQIKIAQARADSINSIYLSLVMSNAGDTIIKPITVQPFYRAFLDGELDTTLVLNYIDSIVKIKFIDKDRERSDNLITSLNYMAKANSLAQENPRLAYYLVNKADESFPNSSIDSFAGNIISTLWINNYRLQSPARRYSNTPTQFSIAPNGTRFAFLKDSLFIGIPANGSLSLRRVNLYLGTNTRKDARLVYGFDKNNNLMVCTNLGIFVCGANGSVTQKVSEADLNSDSLAYQLSGAIIKFSPGGNDFAVMKDNSLHVYTIESRLIPKFNISLGENFHPADFDYTQDGTLILIKGDTSSIDENKITYLIDAANGNVDAVLPGTVCYYGAGGNGDTIGLYTAGKAILYAGQHHKDYLPAWTIPVPDAYYSYENVRLFDHFRSMLLESMDFSGGIETRIITTLTRNMLVSDGVLRDTLSQYFSGEVYPLNDSTLLHYDKSTYTSNFDIYSSFKKGYGTSLKNRRLMLNGVISEPSITELIENDILLPDRVLANATPQEFPLICNYVLNAGMAIHDTLMRRMITELPAPDLMIKDMLYYIDKVYASDTAQIIKMRSALIARQETFKSSDSLVDELGAQYNKVIMYQAMRGNYPAAVETAEHSLSKYKSTSLAHSEYRDLTYIYLIMCYLGEGKADKAKAAFKSARAYDDANSGSGTLDGLKMYLEAYQTNYHFPKNESITKTLSYFAGKS